MRGWRLDHRLHPIHTTRHPIGEGEGVRLLRQALEALPERVVTVRVDRYLFASDSVSGELERDGVYFGSLRERHPDTLAEVGGLPAGESLQLADVPLQEKQDHGVSIRSTDGRQFEALRPGQIVYANLPGRPPGSLARS